MVTADKTSNEQKITNWVTEKRECSAARAHHITELIINCVIKDLLPFRFWQIFVNFSSK